MTPLGLLGILLTIGVTLAAGSRRAAALALVAGSIYVTQGQGVNLGGFYLFPTRIFEVAGFCRILSRGELFRGKLTAVDKWLVAVYVYTAVVYCLRSSEGQANEIGNCGDWILAYVLFRSLIRGLDDFKWLIRILAVLLIPYAMMVLVERRTGVSLWSGMGGLSNAAGWTRGDKLRCQGSFRHPSLLGSLGASFLPLYIAMMWEKTRRLVPAIGIGVCVAVVWASNSGGPMSFAAIGVLGWCMWRIRTKMKWVRRGLSFMLLSLPVFMKAPPWFVLERVSDITGGDGWHRSELVDRAVSTMGHWWVWGMDLKLTADWFPYELDTGVADICDQFVSFALQAGIVAVVMFVVMLVYAFKQLAWALAEVREHPPRHPPDTEFFLWGMGVMLVGHIFNWLGITYFDQTYFIFSMQLSAFVALTEEVRSRAANPDDAAASFAEVEVIDPIGESHAAHP